MDSEYDRRQRAGQWPTRRRWNPDVPAWYVELLGGLAADLTSWRDHDPPQRLDPRCDPRGPHDHVERRAAR